MPKLILLLAIMTLTFQACTPKVNSADKIGLPVIRHPLESLLDCNGNPEVVSMSETSDGTVHKEYSLLGVYARSVLDIERELRELKQKLHEWEMYWFEHDKRVAEIIDRIVDRLAVLEEGNSNCLEQKLERR